MSLPCPFLTEQRTIEPLIDAYVGEPECANEVVFGGVQLDPPRIPDSVGALLRLAEHVAYLPLAGRRNPLPADHSVCVAVEPYDAVTIIGVPGERHFEGEPGRTLNAFV